MSRYRTVLAVAAVAAATAAWAQVPTSAAFPPLHRRGAGGEGAMERVDVNGFASGTYALHLSDAQRWIAGKTFVVE